MHATNSSRMVWEKRRRLFRRTEKMVFLGDWREVWGERGEGGGHGVEGDIST